MMPHSPHATRQRVAMLVHAAAKRASQRRNPTVVAWRAEYAGGPLASTQEWTTKPTRRVYVFDSGRRDERAPEAPAPMSVRLGDDAVLGWYEPLFEGEGLRMLWYPAEGV